jgi:hypothetical protein
MPKPGESKHDRFMRLMTRRLGRALEELRLISQLSSDNYENKPHEAAEVVRLLDLKVTQIAEVFEVPYASATGEYAQQVIREGFTGASKSRSKIDETDIAKAIGLLNQGKHEEAKFLLKALLLKEAA